MDKNIELLDMCHAKAKLMQELLYYTFQQQELNIKRGGSCWGCNANASLISLTQFVVGSRILSVEFDYERDWPSIQKVMQGDLCIFTLDVELGLDTPRCQIRSKMYQQVCEKVYPILDACQHYGLESTTLYKRLRSAAEGVARLAPQLSRDSSVDVGHTADTDV